MRDDKFLKRLERELPEWIARGWVRDGASADILQHVAQHASRRPWFTLALAIMGVMLLGAGVILFFAANWAALPKFAKLVILFSALAASYAAAGVLRERAARVSQALLLLGVILFGANIFLIAQIYHIDSHYPNGVLLWSLGGLLVAVLLNSQSAGVACLALALLWSGMEMFGFNRGIHWPFLLLWLAAATLIVRRRWRLAAHIAMSALLLWDFLGFVKISDWGSGGRYEAVYYLQFGLLFYALMYVLVRNTALTTRFHPLSGIAALYCLLAVLAYFFALTFPQLYRLSEYPSSLAQHEAPAIDENIWTFAIAALLVSLWIALAYARRRIAAVLTPLQWRAGAALVLAVSVLVTITLFAPHRYRDFLAIAFNGLFFVTAIWLSYYGAQIGNRALVNLAFLFFALALLARYFDTFWSLMNRSFFFIGGGLLLLVGGYLLERQRRKLTQSLPGTPG